MIRVYIILTMTINSLDSGLRVVACGSEVLSDDSEELGNVCCGVLRLRKELCWDAGGDWGLCRKEVC
jgi:hypothetical protein